MMSSFTPARILVFGATGNIGKYITESLLQADPAFGHLAIFTSNNTVETKAELLKSWKAKGLTVIVGDVTNADDVAAAYKSENADTVISCLGRGALHTQTELIRLAEASGTVQWFFPSEFGTDIEYGPSSVNEKPHQNKLAVRKYIRESVHRMEVTYLVTGPYFDSWARAFPGLEAVGTFDLRKKEAYVIDDGEGKIGFCTMSDVGKCLVAAVQHPKQAMGKVLKVQSFVVTPNEILAEYERQTNTPWKVLHTPLADLRKIEAEAWESGSPAATSTTLRRIWSEGGTLYEKNDNEIIGLEPEDMDSLEIAVRKVISQNEN